MFAWFDKFSLRAKLAVGFGALIGLILIGEGSALYAHGRSLDAMDSFLEGNNRIAELSLESNAAMGKARGYEKEFLLKVQVFGYEEAKSRYATLLAGQLTVVRENMAAIRNLTTSAEVKAEALFVEEVTRRYETHFLHVVRLYGRLGRMDSGLEGQIRTIAHGIEALLVQGTPEHLRTDLLTLRRYEKDFILRGLNREEELLETAIDRFEEDVARSELAKERKSVLTQMIEQYRAGFRDYVATTSEINAATLNYLGAVHEIEPRLEHLHFHSREAVVATRDGLRGFNRTITLMLVVLSLFAILLGMLVAVFIVRNANRSVAACVNFASNLASGDWTARLPPSPGHNEFTVLITALNRMADEMGETHGREKMQTVELLHLNRTLHMLSRCNEVLMQAGSELELLETICHQIVDLGGYALVWVGFACHDEGKSIKPAALAGADEDYVASLNLTWGDELHRRGVGGLAIREGRIVVVHNIPDDPLFETWREETSKHGFTSCMVLPLKDKTTILGILNIYSLEARTFDTKEVGLLQELASDLAFGVVRLREAERLKTAEQTLDYQANFDLVTSLPNRNLYTDRLRQAIAHASRSSGQLAIFVLSLDRLKAVKDSLGHTAGDALLQHVGHSLTAVLRQDDTVARLAGNDFAVTIGGIETEADVVPVALKLLAAVLEPLTLSGCNVYTSASMGISIYPRDGTEPIGLLQNADAAKSSAKSIGGNLFRFYAAEMNERILLRFTMESELRRALEQNEMRVYFQPRTNLANGKMSGAEALIRWQHPDKGLVPPSDFIPLAEETGLILPLGEWVIKCVCQQQRAWLDAGLSIIPVAVNLSALQFRQESLAQFIGHELKMNQLDAHYLEMEITESTLMDNPSNAVATLSALREVGIKFALDDFGTGHSSLSRLRSLPISHLKIDQSFVRNLTTDPEDAAVCLSIIGLAHHLHMTVIAEGVETEGQANYLRQHRCDEMQGYYFSRPLPAGDFERLLIEHRTLVLPAQTPNERQTLLLLDDEANVLSALERVLDKDGYEILTARSAREGFELLATRSVQVVVSDLRMRDMNGTEFFSRVRDLYPSTVRLILSGYADLDSVTEAINRGAAYKFLTKPWDNETLRTNVRDAFHYFESQSRNNEA